MGEAKAKNLIYSLAIITILCVKIKRVPEIWGVNVLNEIESIPSVSLLKVYSLSGVSSSDI